jgi:glutamyl-tRNA synthetase
VVLPEDALPWISVVYGELPPLSDSHRQIVSEAGTSFFTEAVSALDRHGPDLKELGASLRTATGRKGQDLYMPLRVALTGRLHGPELAPLLKLLPPGTARRRLETWSKPH